MQHNQDGVFAHTHLGLFSLPWTGPLLSWAHVNFEHPLCHMVSSSTLQLKHVLHEKLFCLLWTELFLVSLNALQSSRKKKQWSVAPCSLPPGHLWYSIPLSSYRGTALSFSDGLKKSCKRLSSLCKSCCILSPITPFSAPCSLYFFWLYYISFETKGPESHLPVLYRSSNNSLPEESKNLGELEHQRGTHDPRIGHDKRSDAPKPNWHNSWS